MKTGNKPLFRNHLTCPWTIQHRLLPTEEPHRHFCDKQEVSEKKYKKVIDDVSWVVIVIVAVNGNRGQK